jgi:hypothetical protein
VATQVYRVVGVQTAIASPVARLQAIDEDGQEVRLELPAALVQRTAPGHVLVLHWSIHALPEPLAAAAAQPQAADPQLQAEASPLAAATSPRAVDDAFMDLMSRVRRGASATPPMAATPPASQTRSEPDINDEFNKLLGSARTKG